jgi:hypothetical protein
MPFFSDNASWRQNLILYKPLRGSTCVTWPSLPEGYSLSILSSRPEGYIDKKGVIVRRPAAGQPDITVEVSAQIAEAATGRTENVTLTLPVSAVYNGPVVNTTAADAKDAYLKKKLGIFVHYVPTITQDQSGALVNDVDALADRFDAPQFASDIHDFGADYVIFTTWHLNALTLYPSAVNKRWRDDRRVSPGCKTYSDRDLIAALAVELRRYDIDLHLYTHPVEGHDFTPEDQKLTGWNWGVPMDGGGVKADNSQWNQYINELYDETCRRYAGLVKGLWIDGGCARPGIMNPVLDHPRFRDTMLAYDPSLILSVNTASIHPEGMMDTFLSADYQSWEVVPELNDDSVGPGFGDINPETDNSNAATWTVTRDQLAMVISPARWWIATKTDAPMAHGKERLFQYIVLQSSISVSGGVALSFGCFPDHGNIWESNIKEELTALNKTYLAPIAKSIKGTVPGKAYSTPEKSWLKKIGWGVSTESPDGSVVYLHIMDPPRGSRTLHIGPTADGSELGGDAVVLNYDGSTTKAAFTKTGGGYDITLPEGTDWHNLDTVVQVSRLKTHAEEKL